MMYSMCCNHGLSNYCKPILCNLQFDNFEQHTASQHIMANIIFLSHFLYLVRNLGDNLTENHSLSTSTRVFESACPAASSTMLLVLAFSSIA